MSPEEKALLEKTHELAIENNKMLSSLLRRARISSAMKIFYWVLIIALSFGAYYLIQPYLEFLLNIGGQVTGNPDAVNSARNITQNLNLENLLK